jgi:hypothetical protein
MDDFANKRWLGQLILLQINGDLSLKMRRDCCPVPSLLGKVALSEKLDCYPIPSCCPVPSLLGKGSLIAALFLVY